MKNIFIFIFAFVVISLYGQPGSPDANGKITVGPPFVTGTNTGAGELASQFLHLYSGLAIDNSDSTAYLNTLEADSINTRALVADTSELDLVIADSTKTRVLDYSPPHGSMTFADSSTVVALTQNIWAKLTGPVGDVYTLVDTVDMTIAGDTITIEISGDYVIWLGLSFEGGPSDVFHIAVYVNSVITPFEMHRKTSNNDTGSASLNGYLDNLAVGDDVSFYIRNTGDSDDATLISSQVTIFMLHPR